LRVIACIEDPPSIAKFLGHVREPVVTYISSTLKTSRILAVEGDLNTILPEILGYSATHPTNFWDRKE
jgi:hypothetical protein